MNDAMKIIILLILLTVCSGCKKTDSSADTLVAQIRFTGSYHAANYVIKVFADNRLQVTTINSADSAKGYSKEQHTITVSKEWCEDFINAVNNFVNEDFEPTNFHMELPDPCWGIIASLENKRNELDGSFFVKKVDGVYYQTESAEKIKSMLDEVSPIKITFVRAED